VADTPEGWTCPVPLRGYDRIVMGHGGGGKLSSELIEHLIVPAFNGDAQVELHDAATVPVSAGRLAFSTDSYVVRPLFFTGGCIGDLAVNGTVNDLAMSGAQPIAMSVGFILEEGLPMATLAAVVEAMAAAAAAAGVPIVTGDTKVVGVGQADGMYVNTAGVGTIPGHVDIRPGRARPGDVVILSGSIGEHGVAVLSTREGFEFGTDVRTDSAPLNGLVADMVAAFADIHVLRDATRGGVTAVLCEIAASAQLGIEYDERTIPVPPAVAAACSFLGLDAMHIANEGKLVAFVPPEGVDGVMDAMQRHDLGRDACVIGRVVDDHPGVVVARTALGARRVVDVPLGEQLPRIC
jgi:hydrogenase expression/formation protein HypE